MAYDNTNRGALFKNDKQGNDARPDYTGKINIEGDEYFLSAWLKKAKSGATFMSLSVKRATGERPQPAPQQEKAPEYDDSEVPF
jgi:hypothetical protein